MDEVNAPLLLPDGNDRNEEIEKIQSHVIIPKRTIIVEPLLISFIFFALPSSMVSSQYILSTYRSELGVNFTMNHSLCNQTDSDDPMRQLEAEAQSKAAYFSLWLDLIQGIPSAIIGLFLGNYSDKAGRKFAIVPPCIGLTFRCLSFVLVIWLKANIFFLFIGAFLDGLCGSFTTLLCGCLAYVTDITTIEKRTFRITVVEMCMILPSAISAIATGYLIRASGYLPPFIIMLIGVALCTVYAILFIPETIVKEENVKFASIGYLKEAFCIYFRDNGQGRSVYLVLLLCSLIGPLLVAFSNGIDTLFQMNAPLCWGSVTIGIYSSCVLGVVAVGGLVFANFLRKCFSDAGIILLSGIFSALNYGYKSIVKNTAMMFITLAFYPMGFLFIPTIRSLMSKHVEPTEYGGLFSGIAAIEAISTVVGHVVFNPVYAETNSFWPGAVYIVMGACVLSGIVFFLMYKFVKYRRDKKQVEEDIAGNSTIREDNDVDMMTG